MAIDWTSGYSATWRVRYIDEATWTPGGDLAAVDAMAVQRAQGGCIESGSITVTADPGQPPDAGWYRIEMTARQGDRSEVVQVATMWLTPGQRVLSHGVEQVTMSATSVIERAQRVKYANGDHAPKGVDGAAFVGDMLRRCTPAPVVVDGSFALTDHIVFALDGDVLSAAWQVLNAHGWCLLIDGDGTIHVAPLPTVSTETLDLTQYEPTRDEADGVVTYSYTREWLPDVRPYTLLDVRPTPGAEYRPARVDAQTFTLGLGVTVGETLKEAT